MGSLIEKSIAFTLVVIGAAGVYATEFWNPAKANLAAPFEYNKATPQERSAYLTRIAGDLGAVFKPNYLTKTNAPSTGGRSVTLSYTLNSSKLSCDGGAPCRVTQCKRYLDSPVSAQNISVKLQYFSSTGSKAGTQLLKRSTCQQLINRAGEKQPQAS